MTVQTPEFKKAMKIVKTSASFLNRLGSVNVKNADNVETYCIALETLSADIRKARAAYKAQEAQS